MEEQQFVGFRLEDQIYGLDISNVAGIMNYEGASKVPNSPSYLEGLINVRGSIIPVINLKKRFNLSDSISENSQVILYYLNGSEIGFLVDEANQVIKIQEDAIEQAPNILKTSNRPFIRGLGKINGEIILLLDLDKLLSTEEETELSFIQENN